jgi:hypothetical protein
MEKLGFSEKQVKTILKYKNIVGGNFESKEQLKKCYAISEEKFAQIESYILLPETSSRKDFSDNYYRNLRKKNSKFPENSIQIYTQNLIGKKWVFLKNKLLQL